ncbi:hypothetical protein UPYG_G00034480 [Umbra pygmaea]|uniref:Uncharacterized protein n=1 Tax=Umbra pygmaea TaxID=75934 RepID=A0ABD0XNI7_UMBPY
MMIEDVTETKHMAQKAKRKSIGQSRGYSVEQEENTDSSEGPTCGFSERRTIIEQLEKGAQKTLMPALHMDKDCAPVLLNFLRNLTDDQWREIQQGMKDNLTFEQLSMLCLKIVKIVTQTALKILLPALARILGINLESGSKSPESQCSLTGSESSVLGLEERKLLAREMKYWSKKMRGNGSTGPQPRTSIHISTSPFDSPKRSHTSLKSAPPETETPFTHPLKDLFGITRESLLHLQNDHFNTASASASQLTCAMVDELVNQLNSGLSVAIQDSSGKCSPIMLAGEDPCDLESGKKMAHVASVQMQKLMYGFDGQAEPRKWEDVIEPLMDPLIDEVIDAFMDAMDIMSEDLKVLMNLTKKIKIIRSQFPCTHQRDLKVPPGKEKPSKSLKVSGSSTSAVARKLQALSSPDFQSKALAAVSSILIRKTSVAPSPRPSSAASIVLTPIISAATGIIKTFVGDMEAIACSTEADQVINDQDAGSSTTAFSAALGIYGHMRAKINDFLTLFKPEQGMAEDASLQEGLDTLENISTVEIKLPNIQLSKVSSASKPLPAPCQSDLDDSTHEVLSSLVNVYRTEVLKVESKISDVASPSDESIVAVWFLDDVLLKLSDISVSQSLSTSPDLSEYNSKIPLGRKEPSHSLIDLGSSNSAVARNLQAISSPDFQSKALASVSSILIRKVSSASGVALSSRPSSAASIVLTPVISAATGIIKTFVGDMEAVACSTEAGDQVINDQDAGSSPTVSSVALGIYGHMRAKMNDFLTLFKPEQGMAKDALLQERLDTLENISSVEIQLPSIQLSKVSSASKPLPAPCQSDLDDSTHEVLSSLVNIYRTEVSKVESKITAVASPSDESIVAGWFVDGVLLKLSDISVSQSLSTTLDMSEWDSKISLGRKEPSHSLIELGSSNSAVARKLQALSSTDFQSKALASVSSILIRKVSSASGVALSSRPSSAASIVLTPVISAATGIIKTFVGDMEAIAGSTEAGDQVINDQDAGSSTTVFSAALGIYSHIRAKMKDFITNFTHEQGMAEDASLQDVLDSLKNISTVEINLPSIQLSKVSSASKPLPAPCQSDFDDGTHEVLSSLVNVYRTEVSKVESKLSVVASPSDESIVASWFVDDVLLKLSDISSYQAPSTSQNMRLQYLGVSATLSESIEKLSSKEFQTHAKEAICKVLLTSSNYLNIQESHIGLQNIPQTGLSQDTASGIMDTFVEGLKAIFQSTIGPNESVLLEKGVSEVSAMVSCDYSDALHIRITGSTPKILEETLWSTAVAMCTKLGEKVKDFLTELKPSTPIKKANASKVSSEETLRKILVNIQSEMSTSERIKTSREFIQIKDMVGMMLKQEEESDGDREQVCQETPRTESSLSRSSKTHRSELENNFFETPITDEVPNVISPIVRSSNSHVFVTDMRKNMTSIVDTLMEAVHPEIAGLGASSSPDHTTLPKDIFLFTKESVKQCLLPSMISSTSRGLHQEGSSTSMLSHGIRSSSSSSASALKQSTSTSLSDVYNDTVSLFTRVMVKQVMETTSAAQYVDSGENDNVLSQTYSCKQFSAKALPQSSTPSGSMEISVVKGVETNMERPQVCVANRSAHPREVSSTPDSSDTAFPLKSLMDSGKNDFLCLASILVLKLLSTITSSVLDGPSQQSVDRTAASQQLISQVLSEFCSASGCSITEAYPQDLRIHRVLRHVNKDLLKEFNSCETLQAAMSTQDPAFDRVLVRSLTKHLVKGCSESSRLSSATDQTGQPLAPTRSQANADMETQQSRRGFFHFPKIRINFKWTNRRNKVSPAVQDPMASTNGTLPLH